MSLRDEIERTVRRWMIGDEEGGLADAVLVRLRHLGALIEDPDASERRMADYLAEYRLKNGGWRIPPTPHLLSDLLTVATEEQP